MKLLKIMFAKCPIRAQLPRTQQPEPSSQNPVPSAQNPAARTQYLEPLVNAHAFFSPTLREHNLPLVSVFLTFSFFSSLILYEMS